MAQRAKRIAEENSHHDCDFRDMLSRVGDKWSLLVIFILKGRPAFRGRFSDLKRSIPGISQRMLTATVRNLERDGVLTRHVYAEVPPRVEYELTTLLTTVSQVSPIKAYFSVSESEYLGMARSINAPHSAGEQPWDARAGLSLTLSDGRRFEHQGRFVAADREVDRGTGTIRLVAAFANPGHVLRPGQYGRVSAVSSVRSRALVVPQRAVADLQG